MHATVTTLFNEFPLEFIFRVFASVAVFCIAVGVLIKLYQQNRITASERNAAVLLSAYVMVMLYFTVLGRYSQSYYRAEPELFRLYIILSKEFDIHTFGQIFINILMFIPVGFLLPAAIHRRGKYIFSALLCLCLTVFIELSQLILRCGTLEFDDILNNFIGGIAGILIYLTASRIYKLKRTNYRK